MKTFNLDDRPIGGSMEPRLAPKIGDTRLNAKLPPSFPNPLVRETNDAGINPLSGRVRRLSGMRRRFLDRD